MSVESGKSVTGGDECSQRVRTCFYTKMFTVDCCTEKKKYIYIYKRKVEEFVCLDEQERHSVVRSCFSYAFEVLQLLEPSSPIGHRHSHGGGFKLSPLIPGHAYSLGLYKWSL